MPYKYPFSKKKKRYKSISRPEAKSEKYKAFRAAVMKRDKYKCRYPKCTKPAKQVHHIIRWCDSVHLRYEPSNGISLCYDCHKKIKGKEKYFILLFAEIVRKTNENNN